MNPTIGINSSIDGWVVSVIKTKSVVLTKGSNKIELSLSETEKFFKC